MVEPASTMVAILACNFELRPMNWLICKRFAGVDVFGIPPTEVVSEHVRVRHVAVVNAVPRPLRNAIQFFRYTRGCADFLAVRSNVVTHKDR